jgi:oxygen-independent coproporphyrinogen-3 oxidase
MADREVPLGIYIHVPFCAARCGYCDFNTYVPRRPGQRSEYVEAALLELAQAREQLGERQVATIFIGGGTPTLLGAGELLRLLDGVRDRFGLLPDAEVTTEANPESTDPGLFRALHRAVSRGSPSGCSRLHRTCSEHSIAFTPPAARRRQRSRPVRPAFSTCRSI